MPPNTFGVKPVSDTALSISACEPTVSDANRDVALALAGSFVLPFGKFKGTRLDALPEGYLEWLARECKSKKIRYYAGLLTRVDEDETHEASDDMTLARVALPLIIFQFEEHLFGLYAKNADALAVCVVALAHLKHLCSTYTGKGWGDERKEGAA